MDKLPAKFIVTRKVGDDYSIVEKYLRKFFNNSFITASENEELGVSTDDENQYSLLSIPRGGGISPGVKLLSLATFKRLICKDEYLPENYRLGKDALEESIPLTPEEFKKRIGLNDTAKGIWPKTNPVEANRDAAVGKPEIALRYNEGKLKWALVDFESLEPMVKVLEFGAAKYAPYNWKKGFPVLELCNSALRHIFAFMRGEDKDPESGLSHVGHAMCNLMYISFMLKHKTEFDNRKKATGED